MTTIRGLPPMPPDTMYLCTRRTMTMYYGEGWRCMGSREVLRARREGRLRVMFSACAYFPFQKATSQLCHVFMAVVVIEARLP